MKPVKAQKHKTQSPQTSESTKHNHHKRKFKDNKPSLKLQVKVHMTYHKWHMQAHRRSQQTSFDTRGLKPQIFVILDGSLQIGYVRILLLPGCLVVRQIPPLNQVVDAFVCLPAWIILG